MLSRPAYCLLLSRIIRIRLLDHVIRAYIDYTVPFPTSRMVRFATFAVLIPYGSLPLGIGNFFHLRLERWILTNISLKEEYAEQRAIRIACGGGAIVGGA
jgi:hypothetical protein